MGIHTEQALLVNIILQLNLRDLPNAIDKCIAVLATSSFRGCEGTPLQYCGCIGKHSLIGLWLTAN